MACASAAVAVLVSAVMFVAFAFWTAAWTRTAESAQMTSLPVITVAVAGTLTAALPARVAEVVDRTPGRSARRAGAPLVVW